MGKRIIMDKDYLHTPTRAKLRKGLYYSLPVEMVRDLLDAEVAHWEDREPKDFKLLKRIYAAAESTKHVIDRENARKRGRKGQ